MAARSSGVNVDAGAPEEVVSPLPSSPRLNLRDLSDSDILEQVELAQQAADDPEIRRDLDALMDEVKRRSEAIDPNQAALFEEGAPYGTSDADAEMAKRALAHYGETDRLEEAGYITADGKLLDFSGRHRQGEAGGAHEIEGPKAVEHSDVWEAIGKRPARPGVSSQYVDDASAAAMLDFIGAGNVRVGSFDDSAVNLEISKPLTQAQRSVIRRGVAALRKQSDRNPLPFTIDVSDPKNQRLVASASGDIVSAAQAAQLIAQAQAQAFGSEGNRVSEGSRFPYTPEERPGEETKTAGPKMRVVHNLSAENLVAADKLGGLPAPSMAVLPEHVGFNHYGGITLIGRPGLGDPAQVPIYDADAYTGRNPMPEYPRVPEKKLKVLRDELMPISEEFDESSRLRSAIDHLWEGDPKRAMEDLSGSAAVMADYLRSQGKEAKQVMRRRELNVPFSAMPAMRAFFKEYGVHSKIDPDEYHKAASKAAKEAIRQYAESVGKSNSEKADVVRHLAKIYRKKWIDGDGEIPFGGLARLQDDAEHGHRNQVSYGATRSALGKALKDDKAGFEDWLRAKIEPLLGTPFIRHGGRKLPYTAENVVLATKQGPAVEKNMTFGPGAAVAAGATKFGDVQHMKNAADWQIKPRADVDAARKASEELQNNARGALLSYYKGGDTWGGLDAMHRAFGRVFKRSAWTNANVMRQELGREGFHNIPDDVIETAIKSATAMKEAPVPYFEAKPHRVVGFNEFAAAVIPKDAPPSIRAILDKHEIPYRDYATEEQRDTALREMARQHGAVFEHQAPYEPGVPRNHAMMQDDMFGPPQLIGQEQTELLPESAGKKVEKLPDTEEKLRPEDIARFRHEGEEPEGPKPLDLFPGLTEVGPLYQGSKPEGVGESKGRIYQARVDAGPDEFLDWDKPILQQGDKVKAAFKAAGLQRTGDFFYDQVGSSAGDRAAVRKKLLAAGIKGIQYVGQDGQRTYVLFDDKTIKITKVSEAHVKDTFGSDEKADQAARLGVAANLIPTIEKRLSMRPTPGQTYVDITGKRLRDAQDAATVMRPFRSPLTENFVGALLDESKKVLAHVEYSSGALDYVAFNVPKLVEEVAALARQTGAAEFVSAHNHPSGHPRPTDDDLDLNARLARELHEAMPELKFERHYVTDHDTVGTIEVTVADGKGTAKDGGIVKVDVSAAPGIDWTAGVKLETPAHIMHLLSIPASDKVHLLYRTNSGVVAALAPHHISALGAMSPWLDAEARSVGAPEVLLVVDGQSPKAYHQAILAAEAHRGTTKILDILALDQPEGGSPRWRSAVGIGDYRPGPRIRQFTESRRLQESGTPYSGRPEGTPAVPGPDEGSAADRYRKQRDELAGKPAEEVTAGGAPPAKEPPDEGPVGSAADDLDADFPLPEAAGFGNRGSSVTPARVVHALQSVFNPESLGDTAKATAGTIRAQRAIGAREIVKAQHELRALSKLAGKLTKKQAVQLWDAAEHWGEPGTREKVQALGIPPALVDGFEHLTQKFSSTLQELGILEPTIAHYVGRYWAGPGDATKGFLARIFGRRPLEGPKTFKKQRTYASFVDGLRAGLKPLTYNFVDSQVLKFTEMQRAIDGRRMVNAEKAGGRAKGVMLGKEPPEGPDGPWQRIGDSNDPAFTIYGPPEVETKEGEKVPVFGRRILGHYYAPPQSAAIWNNALSKGLRGNPIFDALMAPGQAAAQVILGISGFHGVVISQEAMFSEMALGRLPQAVIAPLRGITFGRKLLQEYEQPGTHPELARVLDHMMMGGFKPIKSSELWAGDRRAKFGAALRDAIKGETIARKASGVVRIPLDAVWAAIEGAAWPIMGYYVPHLKAHATYVAVARALQQLKPGAPMERVQQVMADIVKEMDYRFGQVQYDNHFMNSVAKDLGQLIFLAPGWTGGTLILGGRGVRQTLALPKRVFGKGEPPPGGTSSLRYWLAAFAGLAIFNAILTKLLTGENPEGKDFLAFRDGTKDAAGNPNRYRLPGYIMHDLYGWSHHPIRTLGNKLSPGLHWAYALATNRTYYGDMVYNPQADWETILGQIGEFTLKSNQPISLQNIQEARQRGERGVISALPGMAGVSPAPREFVRTPAQNLLYEYTGERGGEAATPEQATKLGERRDIDQAFRSGQVSLGEARAQLHADGLRGPQIEQALKRMRTNPLLTAFKSLPLDEAEKVYELANPEEQALWHHAIAVKRVNAHKPAPQRR